MQLVQMTHRHTEKDDLEEGKDDDHRKIVETSFVSGSLLEEERTGHGR